MYKKSLDEYLIKLKNLIKIQEQEIKDFESAYDRYIYSFDELTKLKSQQDISKLAILHREILDKAMDELSKIIFFNIEDMNKTVLNLNENYNDLVSYLKFILFILSLVVFSFVLYIYKFMALRFKKIDKAISIIKNKEFTNSFEIITVLEKDELSQIETSLYDAILLLRENDIVQKQQNWIKNSIIESTLIIYEKESINQILDSAISIICRKINAGKGAIYLFNNTEQVLQLGSSFACNKNNLKNSIKIGETIIGQVALEKKEILLTNLQESLIDTGIINAVAINTYTYPLVFKNELVGVIELASSENISEIEKKYLIGFIETLSAIIYSTQLLNETNKLLDLTQEQSLILKHSEQKLQLQE